MRSYIAYRNTGEISGVVMNSGAWPEGYDLMSSSPTHPLAIANRNAHASDPAFAGFIAFDCECQESMCNCAPLATYIHYVAEGTLLPKPAITVKVNGLVVDSTADAPLTLTPNTDFTLTLESAVPDGTAVALTFEGAKMWPTTPTLVFSGGVAFCTLKAPAQGMMSRARQAQITKVLRPFNLYVLGWA